MRLAAHTTETAATALDDAEVALLPTGATEQHGPALPLGTDFFAAEAVATSVEREDVVVLPTVPVGVSEHHRQFSGTLWTDPTTFENYVYDLIASVAHHGVRKAVLVNGHGGNDDALERAARRLRNDDVAFSPAWNWWSNVGEVATELFGDGGIGHADAMETSMVMRVQEDLVREDRLAAAEAGAADSWGESVAGASVGFDTADFSESGAVGEPTAGSRDAGERLFERAQADLHALIDWLAEREYDALRPEPHRDRPAGGSR